MLPRTQKSRLAVFAKVTKPPQAASLYCSRLTERPAGLTSSHRSVAAGSTVSSLIQTVGTSLKQLQGGAEGVGAFLETAPPPCYLIYLFSAGLGLPCSEDALVAWVGSKLSRGAYGNWQSSAWTLGIVYVGVVLSDLITFSIGVLLKVGVLPSLKRSLLRDSASIDKAQNMVQKWSKLIGVSARDFMGGVALGALLTMPIQLFVGHVLRDSPSPYLAALALAAGPNLIGHIAGPIATAVGFWIVKTRSKTPQKGLKPLDPGHSSA